MRIPTTIVSGYLGAGKTSLINRMLSEEHQQKLCVLVNDFGAINIDQSLIKTETAQSLAFSNGCICCSLQGELMMQINEVLSSDTPPDHLVIEASGISDPISIAKTMMNDGRLSYAGVVTLVDAQNFEAQMGDPLIADDILHQIRSADLVVVSKTEGDTIPEPLQTRLSDIGARDTTSLDNKDVSPMILDIVPLPHKSTKSTHVGYTRWHHRSQTPVDRRALGDKLMNRPTAIYRMKGFVLTTSGAYELHVVGRHTEAKRTNADETVLVALGANDRISTDDIESWWQGD